MGVVEGILFTIFQILGFALFKLYGWVIVVAILSYLIWQNRRHEQWVSQTEHILLRIDVPKDNEKKELSAEQMFASLHGILRPKSELRKEGSLQEHISFEIASIDNKIQFYVWTPTHLKDFVEGQIYAQYPSVRIEEGVMDYAARDLGERRTYSTELRLIKDDVLPIKTFQTFEVDPLAGITAVLAKLEEPGEEMWIQLLARPLDDSWQDAGMKYIGDVKGGHTPAMHHELIHQLLQLPLFIISNFFSALSTPPEAKKEEKKEATLSTGQQGALKAVEEKIAKLGYAGKIRITYVGDKPELAKQRFQAIVGGFKQFNSTNLNGFTNTKTTEGRGAVDEYRARLFLGSGDTFNIEELASIYHLPHKSVETPNMVWTTVKTSEPPSTLPSETTTEAGALSLFGLTNFRGQKQRFGIKRSDRGRHLYIIGQTGTGKSKLLNLLTLSDIYHDEGFAIVDPHGDFATDMLAFIPEHRIKDVIYFNPADRDFPISFNPLEVTDPAFKNHISSEMIGVLKRMFDSWGPRLEYILRYTLLALLDYPDSTLLGINRMLTEKEYRKKVIKEIQDPVVKAFWVTEFASWNDKFASEAVAPVLNKVGAFTANPLVRNIIGQPNSAMDLRKIMDEGKILVVNLSRGMVGEDNASILGAMLVTKIQLAAMSRANMPLDQRRPFYLYVDEFQNFATDSFAVILSEARKYGLYLTVANQYTSQMPETVRDAVFGNVGSMISFRVSAEDGNVMAQYFQPSFESSDLITLDNQHVVISMSINGQKGIPFSATTLRMPDPENDLTAAIVANSRQIYSSDRATVEAQISKWSGDQSTGEAAPGTAAPAPGAAARPAYAHSNTEHKPNSFLGNLKNPAAPQPAARPASSSYGNRDRGRDRGRQGDQRSGQRTHQSQGAHSQRPPETAHRPPMQPQQPAQASVPRQEGIAAGETVSLRR